MIRIVLAAVAAINLYVAYLCFFLPDVIALWYQLPPIDNAHRFFTMTIGALLSVFGIGAIIALLRPRRFGAIIIMLLLMHFMIFLIDVIVLARGQMNWQVIIPEMIYFLVISTALVRYYPVEKKRETEEKIINKQAPKNKNEVEIVHDE